VRERAVQFELTDQTRASVQDWFTALGSKNGQYLFPSRFRGQLYISTCQYARLVHDWVNGYRPRRLGIRCRASHRRSALSRAAAHIVQDRRTG
jgi:hypothetical protein